MMAPKPSDTASSIPGNGTSSETSHNLTTRDKTPKNSPRPKKSAPQLDHVFVVQRVRAFYRGDRATEVAGVYVDLKDANDMVRQLRHEFIREYGLPQVVEGEEEYGFQYSDLGEEFDGKPSVSGTRVGLSWEFDEWEQVEGAKGWYSCSVECFPLNWAQQDGK